MFLNSHLYLHINSYIYIYAIFYRFLVLVCLCITQVLPVIFPLLIFLLWNNFLISSTTYSIDVVSTLSSYIYIYIYIYMLNEPTKTCWRAVIDLEVILDVTPNSPLLTIPMLPSQSHYEFLNIWMKMFCILFSGSELNTYVVNTRRKNGVSICQVFQRDVYWPCICSCKWQNNFMFVDCR